MSSLRKMIDTMIPSSLGIKPKVPFKSGDQAVLKRSALQGHHQTKELMVGTLVSMSEDGQGAVISLPRPGGRIVRETVPLKQLTPVSDFYKRAAVHANPAFRTVYKGGV
jgi:hypothetical protein